MCDSLFGFHLFTGCDTISAFIGRGIPYSLKLLMTSGHLGMFHKTER